jgi:hypothetical protein
MQRDVGSLKRNSVRNELGGTLFNKKHFDHRLDLIELYLTVRDPGTAKSADAYDGLRRLLINANKGTQVHLAHLASLHKAANSADSLEPIRSKLDEFMTQMGVITVDDPSRPDLYQVTGGKGSELVIDAPAYLALGADGQQPMLVQQGVAHYEEGAPVDDAPVEEKAEDSAQERHDDDEEEMQ